MRELSQSEMAAVSGGVETITVIGQRRPQTNPPGMPPPTGYDDPTVFDDADLTDAPAELTDSDAPDPLSEALEDAATQIAVADAATEGLGAALEQGVENGDFSRDDYVKMGDKFFKIGDVIDAAKTGGLFLTAAGLAMEVTNAVQNGDAHGAVGAIADALIVAGVTAVLTPFGPGVAFAGGIAVSAFLDETGGVAVLTKFAAEKINNLDEEILDTPDRNGDTLRDLLDWGERFREEP